MKMIVGHCPAGVSFRCLDHFRQEICSGKFEAYNFGAMRNTTEYPDHMNPYQPPEWDLTKLANMPFVLLCGKEDLLASPKDYTWLADQLKAVNACLLFREYDLGHLGFVVPPHEASVT